jgi:AraC-like DNA-binding protein
MDILQEHLARARASGGLFARSVAAPPWGLRLPGDIQLAVHAVVRGNAWIWTDGSDEPLELRAGDLALVRGGPDHFIAHEPGARSVLHDEFAAVHSNSRDADDRGSTIFLCGAYRFPGEIGRGLIEALPQVLPLPANLNDPIHSVVALISREMTHDDPGKQTALDRLLDVLVVYGLRAGLSQSTTPPAWLCAAADTRLSPALEAIHTRPAQSWTVDDLANINNMSRATFARVFRQVLGQAPMHYLADWRMTLARDLLTLEGASLAHVADQIGFSSVYAFAAAFRRHHGDSPGRWRQRNSVHRTA